MNCEQFLETHGFGPASVDEEALLAAFREEMEGGLSGRPGALAMLPSFLPIDRPVPAGDRVIVLDAGGTNLRVATVIFDEQGKGIIEDLEKHPMAGTTGELSAEAFFETLVDYLAPVLGRSERIGFCFSYPAEISPECDGKLLRWTKEIRAPQVVGRRIGQGLASCLERRGHQKRITILNDTTATLLAGKVAGQRRQFASHVGFILGTGTNTAYVERNERILKVAGLDRAGRQPINVESGGFRGCPQTVLDRDFDQTTANPGQQIFEKMVSGAYLGPLGLRVLAQGAEEGLLSAQGAALLTGVKALPTQELSVFLANPFEPGLLASLGWSPEDRATIHCLLSAVVARAARLAALNITAAVQKAEDGRDRLHPVGIILDGSTLHRTHRMAAQVEGHLDRLLGGRGLHFETMRVDEAPILGAAVAGLIR
jgi:hexokinase